MVEEPTRADDALAEPIISTPDRPGSGPPDATPTKSKKWSDGRKSAGGRVFTKQSTPRTAPMSSSDYYMKMINIETEKLQVMKASLKNKKWYMEQKIAILREKQRPSTRERSHFTNLLSMDAPPLPHPRVTQAYDASTPNYDACDDIK